MDTAWADKGKPDSFTYAGKAKVGGAHSKEFWTDEAGDRWLFKPKEGAADAFIPHGEERHLLPAGGRAGSGPAHSIGRAREHASHRVRHRPSPLTEPDTF